MNAARERTSCLTRSSATRFSSRRRWTSARSCVSLRDACRGLVDLRRDVDDRSLVAEQLSGQIAVDLGIRTVRGVGPGGGFAGCVLAEGSARGWNAGDHGQGQGGTGDRGRAADARRCRQGGHVRSSAGRAGSCSAVRPFGQGGGLARRRRFGHGGGLARSATGGGPDASASRGGLAQRRPRARRPNDLLGTNPSTSIPHLDRVFHPASGVLHRSLWIRGRSRRTCVASAGHVRRGDAGSTARARDREQGPPRTCPIACRRPPSLPGRGTRAREDRHRRHHPGDRGRDGAPHLPRHRRHRPRTPSRSGGPATAPRPRRPTASTPTRPPGSPLRSASSASAGAAGSCS